MHLGSIFGSILLSYACLKGLSIFRNLYPCGSSSSGSLLYVKTRLPKSTPLRSEYYKSNPTSFQTCYFIYKQFLKNLLPLVVQTSKSLGKVAYSLLHIIYCPLLTYTKLQYYIYIGYTTEYIEFQAMLAQ